MLFKIFNSNFFVAIMFQVFGEYLEQLSSINEYLIISFSPSSLSLEQRWRNNGLSADFLADYFSTFFICVNNKASSLDKSIKIKSAVSYIANELLENAMKYSNSLSSCPICVQLCLNGDSIVFQVTNSLTNSNVVKLQNYIEKFTSSDPEELYLKQLEKNALDEDNMDAGLGFLTMKQDYGAKLGWKFEAFRRDPKEITVTTMVQLAILEI